MVDMAQELVSYIHYANFQCSGYEDSLSECSKHPDYNGQCTHDDDAGVYCSGQCIYNILVYVYFI